MSISLKVCSLLLLATAATSGLAFDGAVVAVDQAVLEFDRDLNRVADALENLVADLEAKGEGQTPVRFVAQFNSPVADEEVAAVESLGGEVAHIFSHAIYGLSGKIPALKIDNLVNDWGSKLRLLDLNHEMTLAMDTTMPQTRARPLVWNAGNNGYDLMGDSNTTIAIMDTGIDPTHPDLEDKVVLWREFHEEGQYSPADYNSHGTFVAGIACGTGQVGGNQPRTELTYTIWHTNVALWPEEFTLHVPVTGNGQITFDMQWYPPAEETCLGFRPLGDPPGELFCATGGQNVQTWPIPGPGYYVASTPFVMENCTNFTILITSPYEHQGDGFNLFQGMAPGCDLAGLKIMNVRGDGVGFVDATLAAMDFLVAENSLHNIKVANISAGTGGSIALRDAASSVMNSGTILVGVAHNGYPGMIGDPGCSPQIITVGAVNDFNALTNYTSRGRSYLPTKPDVLAPGGSAPPLGDSGGLMGVDSNTSDGYFCFNAPDRVPDDYCNNYCGTSWAAPHVAGLAALVIQALERTGYVWNYTQEDALLVKSIILMTATETNLPREINDNPEFDPTLDRGGKDLFEGYGMINADAAVEAVLKSWPSSDTSLPVSITFGNEPADRRCWAAALSTEADTVYVNLAVPATLDADIYIYSADLIDGDPDLVASSINPAEGAAESLVFVADAGVQYYLTIKRISGWGEASLGLGVSPVEGGEIQKTQLVGNYPNPFNPRTAIKFNVGQIERVTVSVYDLAGRQVAVLEDRVFEAGLQEIVWDGCDERGSAVASGSYFVRMESKSGVEQRKVMLVR